MNKRERIRICADLLSKLDEGKLRLGDIITGDESWFYHRRIGHKQSNASWIGQDESPRTVVRRGRFEPKTMFSIFFRTTGAVHLSYVDGGKTIDANTYIEDCLKPVFKVVAKQRPKSGLQKIKFFYDNARPHVEQSVLDFLDEMKVGLIDHPPYSPDLAPSDF
jgi:histone-lysine N-methyltransferase SETMAR